MSRAALTPYRLRLLGALLLICFEVAALSVASEELLPRRALDRFQVSAPRLHFLVGRSLDRLHDGALVPFDFQLSIAAGSKSNIVARDLERFVVSYDLWEERFSVVRLKDRRQSGPHLAANAAEAWCLDNLALPLSALPAGKDLWARLEIRSGDALDSAGEPGDQGLSLAALIDVFSRPSGRQQQRWMIESSAFRMSELRP